MEATQQAVDQPRRDPAGDRVATVDAAARRDVGALERREQLRDVLGRVLKIAIHRHDRFASGPREPRVHRRMLAEVPLQPHGAHARIAGMKPR